MQFFKTSTPASQTMILRSSGLPVRVGGITCYHARQEQKWLKHGHFEAATCFPCLTAPIPRKAALQLQFHSTRHSSSLELELERTIHKEGKDFQGERAISEKRTVLPVVPGLSQVRSVPAPDLRPILLARPRLLCAFPPLFVLSS